MLRIEGAKRAKPRNKCFGKPCLCAGRRTQKVDQGIKQLALGALWPEAGSLFCTPRPAPKERSLSAAMEPSSSARSQSDPRRAASARRRSASGRPSPELAAAVEDEVACALTT